MQTPYEIRNVDSLRPNAIQQRPFAPLTFQERFRFFTAQPIVRLVVGIVIVAIIIGYFVGSKGSSNTEATFTKSTSETLPVPISTSQKDLTIKVYVSGAVNKPGVIELESTDRVVDAISSAGGVTENANLKDCNLAAFIVDGQSISIPDKGQTTNSSCGTSLVQPTGQSTINPSVSGPTAPGKVNLNTATQIEIETLPGIGPTMGAAIIAYRTEHGTFSSVNDLRKVKGIGEKRFADLKDLVST